MNATKHLIWLSDFTAVTPVQLVWMVHRATNLLQQRLRQSLQKGSDVQNSIFAVIDLNFRRFQACQVARCR